MQRIYDKARAIFCDFIDKIPVILVIHHFMCTARLHNECRSGKGRVYGNKWAWYLHFISRIEIQLSIGKIILRPQSVQDVHVFIMYRLNIQ